MQGSEQPSPAVVVRFASQDGSTREIAERIAARLEEAGLAVVLATVEDDAPLPAGAPIVLGSAIHNGRWLERAYAFVAAHREALAAAELWLFSVSSFGDTNRRTKWLMKRVPQSIGALRAALAPRDVRVFAGVVRGEHWPRWAPVVLRLFGSRVGDNRDWPVIDAWADEIARSVLRERS